MSTSESGRPGRPSKGARKARMFRYPHSLDAALAKATEDDSECADVQEKMIKILTEAMQREGYLPTEVPRKGRLMIA